MTTERKAAPVVIQPTYRLVSVRHGVGVGSAQRIVSSGLTIEEARSLKTHSPRGQGENRVAYSIQIDDGSEWEGERIYRFPTVHVRKDGQRRCVYENVENNVFTGTACAYYEGTDAGFSWPEAEANSKQQGRRDRRKRKPINKLNEGTCDNAPLLTSDARVEIANG